MIKIRTQIYLDADDMTELAKKGERNKCSVSQIIRTAIKEYLQRGGKRTDWKKDPIAKLIGKFSSTVNDASINHDQYLYDKP